MSAVARPGLLQGDIVDLEGVDHAILSRSCDLPRDHPLHVVVAPLDDDPHRDALKGWDLRAIPIPGHVGHVADLTGARSVAKADLPDSPRVRGCPTAEGATTFARDVGRFFSAPSHPDGVQVAVRKLWDDLRDRRDKVTYAALVEAIEDIRAKFTPWCDPADEETPRTMTLVFVIDAALGDGLSSNDGATAQPNWGLPECAEKFASASTLADQAVALEAFCRALADRCGLEAPITAIDVEVIGAGDFSYVEYQDTDPLRPEALSHPDAPTEDAASAGPNDDAPSRADSLVRRGRGFFRRG